MAGVALGPLGGAVMGLAREDTTAADTIFDHGRGQNVPLSMLSIWQLAIDGESYIVARPDIVGIVDPPTGAVDTIAEEFSHLYTSDAHAFGWVNSRPGQPKYLDWVAYSSSGRQQLARIDGAERLLDGSAKFVLVTGSSGLLRASRNGDVQSVMDVGDVAIGCVWGERLVLVSASDRKAVRIWSAREPVSALSLSAPVDDLLCGCGTSPYFIALSSAGKGRSLAVDLEGNELELPFPLIRADNPGPFWTSGCEEQH